MSYYFVEPSCTFHKTFKSLIEICFFELNLKMKNNVIYGMT